MSVDLETTGLDLAQDRIVSFGAVPISDGAIDLGGTWTTLVDPGDRPPSRTSVTIHQLRPVDLAAAGISMHEAATQLAALLDRRYLLAWYARVETTFLGRLFEMGSLRLTTRTVDVRDLAIALDGPDAGRRSLTRAAEHAGVPVASPHDALDDALVTAQLFLVLAARLEARDGVRTLGDLLRIPRAG